MKPNDILKTILDTLGDTPQAAQLVAKLREQFTAAGEWDAAAQAEFLHYVQAKSQEEAWLSDAERAERAAKQNTPNGS